MNTELRPTRTVDSVLTPCDGRSAVFDSTDPAMHLIAKAICDTCPFFVGCDKLRQATELDYTARLMEGTWAGKHYRRGQRPPRIVPERARGRAIECAACGRDADNAGRGLCTGCYTSHLRAGTLSQYPTQTVRDDVA